MDNETLEALELEKQLSRKVLEDFLPSINSESFSKSQRKIHKMNEFENRAVIRDIDSWCIKLQPMVTVKAPDGYVVRIPNYFDGMILLIEGSVKKYMVAGTALFLQVDTSKTGRQYMVDFADKENLLRRI